MQEKNGLLSFCIVGYNHAKYAKSCLDSIAQVLYPNKEVVILDDGSSDNSVSVISESIKKLDFSVKTIFQKNTGNVPANFNKVIEQSSGEYIIMMSLDDVVCYENIPNIIAQLKANKDIPFIASSSVVTINCNDECSEEIVSPLKLDSLDNHNIDDLLELEYSEFGAFYIQGAVWRRSVIESAGKFDEDLLGDDIVLRTKVFRYLKSKKNNNYIIQKKTVTKYRRHNNNLSKNYVRQIQIVSEYLDRYWPDRETPKLFIDWILYTIGPKSFKDSLKVLGTTSRALELLDNSTVFEKIKKKYKRENSIFNYVFEKKKHGNEREIIIFSLFKVHYTKNSLG